MKFGDQRLLRWVLYKKHCHMQKTLLAMGLLASLAGTAQTARPPAPTVQADAWLKQLTTEEKVRLLVGMGMKIPGLNLNLGAPVVGQTNDAVPGAAGTTFAVPRLGIKSTVVADGPAGLRIAPFRNGDSSRSFYCTAFPIASLVASSWDTSLAKAVGSAMGAEARAYGIDVILAPALNLHRNPLGGRNFEYYSEDPLVSGYMAAAFVNGAESHGIGTSIKHYAANNQETNRNTVDTRVTARTLRELYLRGFELTVKRSQPWTVMSSYNLINGVSASHNRDLLTEVLRNEWGFKGLVMTDWFGGTDAVAQMNAGNDLLMPGTEQQAQSILTGLKEGKISAATIDANVRRMLLYILQTPSQKGLPASNQPDLKAHAAIARRVAAEGMVLLKNEAGVLPLAPQQRIAAFGLSSYNFVAGGTGSGDVNEAYSISLAEGLSSAGYQLDEELAAQYRQHLSAALAKQPKMPISFMLPPPLPEMPLDPAVIAQKAGSADIAFVTIGRNSGEFQDRKLAGDFDLTPAEQALLTQVSQAFHARGKKVVVILNVGGVIETASWRQLADAILLVWQGGQEGGHAATDVLKGAVNPSGRLPMSFPIQYSDVPSAGNFPGKELSSVEQKNAIGMPMGKPAEVTYEEGIYVGYRYYATVGKPVAYPFGFGLSYTSFSTSPVRLSANSFGNNLTAQVTVTNTGKTAGKQVVQWYLQAPNKDMHKPAFELRGFGKTKLLQPGESQTLSITLQPRDLASFSEHESAWVAHAGQYRLYAAASSEALGKPASFVLPARRIVEKCGDWLLPRVSINEWQLGR